MQNYNLKGKIKLFTLVAALLLSQTHPCHALSPDRHTPVVKVVEENAESVVNISTERILLLRENPTWRVFGDDYDTMFQQFSNSMQPSKALKLKSVGSGVIVDKKGLIITNAHVVNMANTVFVIMSDGKSVQGKVVYQNPKDDLAIVEVAPENGLKEAKLANASDIRVGESVVAVGNPLGLENSVSVGIVSGKGRVIHSATGAVILDNLLQTDAPINIGNSGGALFNLDGELVGINVAVVQNSQGIGLAIPADRIEDALESYKTLAAKASHGK